MFGLLILFVGTTVAETYSYHKVGQFSIPNPAFMKVITAAGGSKSLYISSFSGNPFVAGQVHQIRDVLQLLSNPSAVQITSLPYKFSWPNFVEPTPPDVFGAGAVSVADGFLVPFKSTGGVYVLKPDGQGGMSKITLTVPKSGYFYHNVTWIDMDGDGDLDLLTARATVPIFGSAKGELVWLENHGPSYPWPEHVITEGPDVIVTVLNSRAGPSPFIEVVAAQFFSKKLVLYQINKSDLTVAASVTIDDQIGAVYAAQPVDLDLDGVPELLVNNHEDMRFATRGIWAYQRGGKAWNKTLISDGFEIREKGMNQGTPGFVYPFHPNVKGNGGARDPAAGERPYLLVAGDGSQEAYLLRPQPEKGRFAYDKELVVNAGGVVGSIEIADIDGDGYVEFFVPNYDKGYVEVYSFKPQ